MVEGLFGIESNRLCLLFRQMALNQPLKADILEPLLLHLRELFEGEFVQNLNVMHDVWIPADKPRLQELVHSGIRLLVQRVEEDAELLIFNCLIFCFVALEVLEILEELSDEVLHLIVIRVEGDQDVVASWRDLRFDASQSAHILRFPLTII